MQPELPWNVAGIGPEAREAARASARREGLSVGEWLTRRILRGLAENGQPADRWWTETPRSRDSAPRFVEPEQLSPHIPFSTQDSADLLARISRSEGETQSSWRRIEEQLRTLARRLEQTERSQTENSRAVNQAAAEMNVAAREQAQHLDQLGANVTGLGDRLSRLEQNGGTEGYKDAIKALHQGLSRLADQMSESACRSATQATELAGSIETVAGKLAETRNSTHESQQAVEERIATLAANVSSLAAKLVEMRNDTGHLAHALEARLTASEKAVENLETDRVASAALESRFAASEKAIEQIDAGRAAHAALETRVAASEKLIGQLETEHASNGELEADIRRQSTVLKEMADTVDTLAQRLPTIDSKLSGNFARLDTAVGGRLLSLENKLADVTERLEESEHNKPDSGALEADVQSMGVRIVGLESRLKGAIADLEALAREATVKRDFTAAVPLTAPEPAVRQTSVPQFDLPPFAEFADAPAATHETEPHPANDTGAAPVAADFTATAVHATNAFAAAQPDVPAEPETFLAAARRSAQAATDTVQDQRRSMFSWGDPAPLAADTGEREKTRVVLLAGLGILIVTALVAGIVLSRTFTSSSSPAAPIAAQTTMPAHPKAALSAVTPKTNIAQTNAGHTKPTDAEPAPEPAPVAESVSPPAPDHKTHALRTRTAAAVTPRLTPPAQTAPRTSRPPPAQAQPTTAAPTKLAALASSGNAKAEELLGLQYIDGSGQPVNEAEGAKWLERAASQGQAVAAYRLGTLYERGQGMAADQSKAVQWYSVAAKAGNRKAMHNLAVAYAQGSGVQKDMASAAQWFGRAAALGLADSQFNLAVLYERGMGVPQSLSEAYKWYAIAAAQGDVESKTRLEALDSQMNADDKASAQKAASDFHANPPNRGANAPPDSATVLGG
jgi:localization factor PodJL